MRIGLLFLFQVTFYLTFSQNWDSVLASNKGSLEVFWYTSRPFIYEKEGKLEGIEVDILKLFQEYTKEKLNVNLEVKWIEDKSFVGILEEISVSDRKNKVGASAFSITPEREKFVQFTRPYFPDVTVLVSSEGTPILENVSKLLKMMNTMEAVTIRGTTYEKMLLDIQKDFKLDLNMLYIDSDQNILDFIGKKNNRFGFIDLPIYLMLIEGGGDLTRQNLFMYKGSGYGYIFPKESKWIMPFNEFLSDPTYKEKISKVLTKYLGNELFDFLKEIRPENELSTSILTKEKEIQLELIRNANLQLERESLQNRILFVGIGIISALTITIFLLFYKNRKATKILSNQKEMIENQRQNIQLKNDQLLYRNGQLLEAIDEKNGLVGMLAHDLRSPLSQIIGFVNILQMQANLISEDHKEMLNIIAKQGFRIDEMIKKILRIDEMDKKAEAITYEMIHISLLFKELKERFVSSATEKGIELIAIYQKDLKIESDKLLLQLILENLISNAIKFSNKGTQVKLIAEVLSDELILKVQDQGPGFSESDKLLAFNRFQKLSAKPTGGESTIGLGLSIVKKYTNVLRGEVSIESTLGVGSTIILTFPITKT